MEKLVRVPSTKTKNKEKKSRNTGLENMAWKVPETYSWQVGRNGNSVPDGKGSRYGSREKRGLWFWDVKRKDECLTR